MFAGALLLLVGGCGEERSTPAPSAETDTAGATAPAPAPAPATETGAVVGKVTWRGKKPPMKSLAVERNPEVCGRSSPFQALTVAEDGGISDAVVSIDADGPAPPVVSVVLDQVGCRYVPHVVALGVGSALEIRSSDEVLHNVHANWTSPDPALWFNLATPTKGFSVRRDVPRAGVAHVVCDAGHTWMSGWIHAFPHALHAVTGADGTFRIDDVPVGTRTLRLWHEGWNVEGDDGGRPRFSGPVVVTRPVTVTVGAETRVDLTLSNEPLPVE